MKVNELKGRIVANGYTQENVAKMLGISAKTFNLRLKKGCFGTDEAAKLVEILGIDLKDAADIFLS